MRLAPARRSIATGPAASCVANGERDPLGGAEGTGSATEVEHLAATTEYDWQQPRLASHASGCLGRHAMLDALDGGRTIHALEIARGDDNPHRWSHGTENRSVANRAGDAHEVDQGIQSQVVVGALIGDNGRRVSPRLRIDKPRPSSARAGRRIEGGDNDGRRLGVEHR